MFARLRVRLLLLVVFVVLAAVGAVFAASSAGTVKAVTNGAFRTKIVVDAGGFTLYHRTSEKKGSIGCTGACRKVWPPLLLGSAKLVAGAGLSASKLGTIKRPDGGVQVTYNGYALYLYSGDKKAGQTHGQGVGGLWYAITPAGTVTKAKGTPTSAPTKTTTTSRTAPTTTSAAPPKTTTTTGGGVFVSDPACGPGEGIPQGMGGDDDEDNNGGPTDGDGCL